MDALEERIAARGQRRKLPDPAVRRALRRSAGLTLADIALVVGTSQASVCRWESGHQTPRGEALSAYVDVLTRLGAIR